jgi:biotin operon repressor
MKVGEVAAKTKVDVTVALKKALAKSPMSEGDLADLLDCSPAKVRATIAAMKAKGAMIINTVDGRYDLANSLLLEPGKHEVKGAKDDWTHRFGVTTDNHLCNKHSRLDVLNAAYDHFEREGITTVYNCGNWIDGEARFNKTELVTAPGMDNQLDYFIDKFPQRKGITTFYIAGDDHEGWFQQREGIEIGKYAQMRAEEQGRHDLKYLGYAECDVALKYGSGTSIMRVVHPGGGSAYAISYTDQKRTESYQGGEKPQVELVGHYHKFNQGYPREVHTVQCGCTSDQSLFMRKKRLQAHVGFVEIKIKQDSAGIVTRFAVEWHPWYDRGFYEKRYK